MIKSMTGYGKSEATIKNKRFVIEIRSVNSKQLDLNLRLNAAIRSKEAELKNVISTNVDRGKVDIAIYAEQAENTSESILNTKLIKQYYKELQKLAKELKANESELFGITMKMPDVFSRQEQEELVAADFKKLQTSLNNALKAFNEFRIQEGKSLEKDFLLRLKNISTNLQKIEKADKVRLTNSKDRLRNNVQDTLGKGRFDENRLEQELIYYLEKLDITEEKVRLKNHLDYFLITMKEPSCGRKLGFIAQEIGREVNTIGSKANNSEIQKMVVEMKDELEKIKEQINNVL